MQIEWLPGAIQDLQRLREFIIPHNREAARRAVTAISGAISILQKNPQLGKPAEDLPDFRDIIIPFGSAGYVLRYRSTKNAIIIIAIKHGKEAGFKLP